MYLTLCNKIMGKRPKCNSQGCLSSFKFQPPEGVYFSQTKLTGVQFTLNLHGRHISSHYLEIENTSTLFWKYVPWKNSSTNSVFKEIIPGLQQIWSTFFQVQEFSKNSTYWLFIRKYWKMLVMKFDWNLIIYCKMNECYEALFNLISFSNYIEVYII